MTPSPIENKIGSIFIPVSDMQRAIAWYCQLFGQPIKPTSHEGRIYDLTMSSEVGLILDGHKLVSEAGEGAAGARDEVKFG